MDYSEMLSDAFRYSRDGVFNNVNRWLKLILAVICLGIPFNGYIMRIYRGGDPAPEADRWGELFIDGLKLLVVGLVYAIPLMILWALIYGPFFLGLLNGSLSGDAMASWEPNFILMILFYVAELALAVIMPIAAIRFARTGSFGEAFNIGAIAGTISAIGWIRYIVALVLVSIVVSIPILIIVFGFIIAGGLLLFSLGNTGAVAFLALLALLILVILILAPLFGVFQARYLTRVYDSRVA